MDFFLFAENLRNYTTANFLGDLQIALEYDERVKAIQIKQWDDGVGSDGSILGIYTKATEIITDGRKKAGEPYDINDTGETRRNTELFANQENNDLLFYFDSKSKALPDLLEKVGQKLFGINQKNMPKFIEIAQETAYKILSTNLKLK